jgi:transcriptional regulator with XRE-family HTH domain
MATARRSNQAFPQALTALMKRSEVSYRRLADLTKTTDRPLSSAYLGHLGSGRSPATIENMQTVAQALGVEPEYFREYREHIAAQRARSLAARHGMDAVLAKLAELDADAQPRVDPGD